MRQVSQSAPVGVHDGDLESAPARERDQPPVRRPREAKPGYWATPEVPLLAPVGVHDVEVGLPGATAADAAKEGDPPPVRRPLRAAVTHPVSRQPSLPAPV